MMRFVGLNRSSVVWQRYFSIFIFSFRNQSATLYTLRCDTASKARSRSSQTPELSRMMRIDFSSEGVYIVRRMRCPTAIFTCSSLQPSERRNLSNLIWRMAWRQSHSAPMSRASVCSRVSTLMRRSAFALLASIAWGMMSKLCSSIILAQYSSIFWRTASLKVHIWSSHNSLSP